MPLSSNEVKGLAKQITSHAYWLDEMLPFLLENGNSDRLLGANKDNFQRLQGEINAYKTILNKVEADTFEDLE